MSWERQGRIFQDHHAQLPVCASFRDRFRIYYSTREEGKSVPLYFEVDAQDPSRVIYKHRTPILKHGRPGTFDHYGVMPTCWLEKDGVQYLYYVGWSRREDVPYHNSLGLATSTNGMLWVKYSEGPVLSTSYKEPGYIGTAEVLVEDDLWKMWYLSCRSWILHEGKMEPIYDIKYAISENGVDWEPQGKAIELTDDEGGISAARVIRLDDGSYEMYFSSRGKVGYRSSLEKSYRIRKATSTDGLKWSRINTVEFDISSEPWEDFMVCYPSIVKAKDELLMFYNGNGFGKTGIGYAKKI